MQFVLEFGLKKTFFFIFLFLCCVPQTIWANPVMPLSVSEIKRERIAASQELYNLNEKISISQDRIADLKKQVAVLQESQVALRASLIKIAAQERALENPILLGWERLQDLQQAEQGQMAKLAMQQEKLSHILAFLEQFQLRPPPTLLVRPDDALSSVRSAMLLSALLPALHEQAKNIQTIVQNLAETKQAFKKQYEQLVAQRTKQEELRLHLSLLRQQQQNHQQESARILQEEQKNIEQLKNRTHSLKDLVIQLDAQNQKLFSKRSTRSFSPSETPKLTIHQLNFPVLGKVMVRFGQKTQEGIISEGEKIQSAAGRVVTLPASGRILYAGEFRSYGKLLIVDLGSNYQLVMAGFGELNVQAGQFVTADEPVGFMPRVSLVSANQYSIKDKEAILYVELRKNGKAIDIGRWWKPPLH